MVITLVMTALYNAILAVLIYAAEKRTAFGRLPYRKKQWIVGILFGAMAAFASTSFAAAQVFS